jgi:hypothetical protein
MSDGYAGLYTPMNSKEFEAMVADVRSHIIATGAAGQSVGVDLRRLLPRAKNVNGAALMFGLDLHIAARQVARQFAQFDAAMQAGAAALARGHQIYYGTFSQAGRSGGGAQFDAS